MALASEALRRAGFKCVVCPITKRRRLYVRCPPAALVWNIQVAIVRTREGWFVGKPYRDVRVAHPAAPGVYSVEHIPTPIAELQGKFLSWKAAVACHEVTAGVQ